MADGMGKRVARVVGSIILLVVVAACAEPGEAVAPQVLEPETGDRAEPRVGEEQRTEQELDEESAIAASPGEDTEEIPDSNEVNLPQVDAQTTEEESSDASWGEDGTADDGAEDGGPEDTEQALPDVEGNEDVQDAEQEVDDGKEEFPNDSSDGEAVEASPDQEPTVEMASVTLVVDMSCSDLPSFSSVFVTGPFNDWCGECHLLEDLDGDGLYAITLMDLEPGTELEYKFGVDNWSHQEELVDDMLEGASCAPVTDLTEYANRLWVVTPGASELVHTYGSCSECPTPPVGDPTLTLRVSIPGYGGGVTVGNSVQGWGSAGMTQLTDPDGDFVFEGTLQLPEGTVMEYKFIKGYNGSGEWETVPEACGLVTGEYVNRVVTMPASDLVLPVVSFGGCETAGPSETLCGNAPGRTVPVVTVGHQLRIGTTPLHMKGVCWSPAPKGGGPEQIDFAAAVQQDSAMMEQAGINVVRTYGPILDTAVLDVLYARGIYVLMTVYYGYNETAASTVEKVCSVKNHPAIIGWLVGNEWNLNGLGDQKPFWDSVGLVGEVVSAIQANDSTRPVGTVYGGIPEPDVMGALSHVDFWGLNIYSGASFWGLFAEWVALSSKPMFLGEYGSDAYSSVLQAENEQEQADIVSQLTVEIHNHSSVNNQGPCAGGMVFEWNDEWWKQNGGSWWVHDTGAPSWTNSAYPDPGIYEEWWGLVDIDRNPRAAYDAYSALAPPQAQ